MQPGQIAAPLSLAELETRAEALSGRRLGELAQALAHDAAARHEARQQRDCEAPIALAEQSTRLLAGHSARRKGKAGQLIERALGATAGAASAPDFVSLGVELKTIPVDARGRPRESTYVCTVPLAAADRADWPSSRVRAKLAHVLFVPIVHEPGQTANGAQARVGRPLFWRPSAHQESVLRGDFDDVMGLIALGRIEGLTSHLGRWLQVRPKAAHGQIRTRAFGADDEPLATLPRGFYLRARFTAALLRDPTTTEP